MRNVRIGIDVGGTFTDFVAVGHGIDGSVEVAQHKTPSTPDDPSRAVVTGLRDLIGDGLDLSELQAVTHGTTLGLNAIIQRSGARVTLVVSTGYRDLLEIGRARLPRSFDLHAGPEPPPVPRDRVIEIDARLGSDGVPVSTPDHDGLDRVAKAVLATEPESVALVLVGGFMNPAFERQIADALRSRLGDVEVNAASVAWPEIREYERGLVAVLGAHIHPLMSRYFTNLNRQLTDIGVTTPLYITGSNGGSLSVGSAIERPLDTVLSGPASGVTAAARLLGPSTHAITFDMGGTSSDMSIILAGRSALTTKSHVGGLPLILPVVDVNAIGAGGGSIAWADAAGGSTVLRVGPRSAGAVPGPACYGLGGEDATITDAYLVAGFIDPEHFLHGQVPLYRHRAVGALAELARVVGLDDTGQNEEDQAVAAADAVLRVATSQMTTEMRKLLAERGHEGADFTLIPFGGAGPTHAAMLAEEVRIGRIVVPESAATFCAMGAAISPLRSDFARSLRRPLDARTFRSMLDVLTDLLGQAREWIEQNGAEPERSTVRITADMRYVGQAYEITVPLAEAPLGAVDRDPLDLTLEEVVEAFGAEHERLYSFADPSATIEIATARLAVVGPEPPLPAHTPGDVRGATTANEGRPLRWQGQWLDAAVIPREQVTTGVQITGPTLIEQGDTTVVIPPGWAAVSDGAGNLHLTKEHR